VIQFIGRRGGVRDMEVDRPIPKATPSRGFDPQIAFTLSLKRLGPSFGAAKGGSRHSRRDARPAERDPMGVFRLCAHPISFAAMQDWGYNDMSFEATDDGTVEPFCCSFCFHHPRRPKSHRIFPASTFLARQSPASAKERRRVAISGAPSKDTARIKERRC